MSELTLVIGNKNFSSWSLRAWLALKATGEPFREIMVRLREPDSKQNILKYSPSGQVPLLLIGKNPVWDSLAIGETLAEMFPDAHLLPRDAHARMHVRSICAEMHAGFAALRSRHPVDMRARIPSQPNDEVKAIITRIEHIWREAKALPGRGKGEFLLGEFGLADAFYAPVVSRFVTYGFNVADDTREYMAAIWSHPHFVEWYQAAEKEA